MNQNTPEPFAPRCTKCFFFTYCTAPYLPDTDDTHAKFCPFYLPYPKY